MSEDNKIALHDFAALVASRAGVGSDEANRYVHQLAKTMAEVLEAGGDIHLYHFGRFHTTHVGDHAGRDPNSGVPLTIPGHSRVHFRPYSALRIAINAPFNQLRIRELAPDKRSWRTRGGFWILLLLALLLILLGLRAVRWVTPLEVSPIPLGIVPVAPATPEPVAPVAATTGFVVSPGDTLWGIAAARLGDPYWWPVIYAENRSLLFHHNPDLIDSGITLRIPTLTGNVNNPTAADLSLSASGYQTAADDYRRLGHPLAAAYERAAARQARE